MFDDHNKIRNEFPILHQQVHGTPLAYLDNAATTQKPQCVLDEVINWYTRCNSNIHRAVHYLSQQATEKYEHARRTIQQFINAQHTHEIVFTHGTTEAINTIAFSLGETEIQAGDEILVSQIEHHANIVPWQLMAERKNARLKYIPLTTRGELDLTVLDDLLTKKTKIVAINHVSNALGTINPIREIIQKAHQQNIPVLIDAAQSVQHLPIDVQELDCEFLVFSGHKIYGPTGIGVMYGKESWLDRLPPYQSGGDMVDVVTMEKTTFNELPLKFEAGTTNYIGAVGLSRAVEYLNEIGLQNIQSHESRLYKYTMAKLRELENIEIYSNATESTAAISFNFPNAHPSDVGMILDKLGVAVRTGTHCTQPIMQYFNISGSVRASIAVYNNTDDIDQFIDALNRAGFMLQ
ncbi:MAG: SufS family cysteine desulfurase [Bacteroidetes bacterium]|jgi:cysteine desulfurase/selenocysteine lyase|nr:SufS family cysteine desulfurase [Bacteroidota bacterium]